MTQHRATVAALSWTQIVDGLLVSDTRGNLRMMGVAERPGGGCQVSMVDRWQGAVPAQPQTALAAGFDASAPAASVSAETGRTVAVWWPVVGGNTTHDVCVVCYYCVHMFVWMICMDMPMMSVSTLTIARFK